MIVRFHKQMERERETAEDERNKYGHTNIYGIKYLGEVSWRQYWLFHFSCGEEPQIQKTPLKSLESIPHRSKLSASHPR